MSASDPKYRYYPEARFGGFTHVDGTLAFYSRVRALLPESGTILDIGCGRRDGPQNDWNIVRTMRNFKSPHHEVVGIDVDPDAARNPHIDRFVRISPDTPKWEVPDCSVDLAFGDWVLEHVEDPTYFFAECRRVLVPGGCLCLRTTNRLGYVGLIAVLVPNRYHTRISNCARTLGEAPETYPTRYKCNTVRAIRRALDAQGFEHAVYGHEAEPSYLRFSRLAYGAGVLYQKFAPGALSNTILAFARKP